MARPRRDGTPARAVNRRKLTDLFVSSRKAGRARRTDLGREAARARAVGPAHRQEGVEGHLPLPRPAALAASGRRPLDRAGRRPAADGAGRCSTSSRATIRRPSARPSALTGTFADLASQYVELHAKKHNKSWQQAENLVARHLLPRWGKLKASAITRADVRAMMLRIEAPIVANQTLAAASRDLLLGDQAGNPHRQSVPRRRPQSDRGPRARAVRRRGQLLWPRARSGAEADPAHRPTARRGRRHAGRAHRRRLVAVAGQAARRLAGTKNGRDHRVALSEPAQALIESHLAERSGQMSSAAAEASWSPSSGSSARRRTICGEPA